LLKLAGERTALAVLDARGGQFLLSTVRNKCGYPACILIVCEYP